MSVDSVKQMKPDESDIDEEDVQEVKAKKCDDNALTKMRKEVLELWKETYTAPSQGLRSIPEELEAEWKVKLPKSTKKPKKNKPIKCPSKDCDKKFNTAGGLMYHYARCGVVKTAEYKCNLCSFVCTLRHLIPHLRENHEKQLPTVPDDLKPALAYKKLRVKEVSKDGSRKSIIRRFVDFDNYIDSTKEYRTNAQNLGLFPDLPPFRSQWKTTFMSMNVPQEETSCNFKVGQSDEWTSLNLFESMVNAPDGHHTFYVGGPVWSSAWAPFPTSEHGQVHDQILAISAALNFDAVHPFCDLEPEPGLIQFWNFGPLTTGMSDFKPRFEFAIAHTYGFVWDMEWCPFGNTYESTDDFNSKIADKNDPKVSRTEILPRLGLLAVGSADGYVRILAIPHPSTIVKESNKSIKSRMFSPEPIVVLCPPGIGPVVNSLPGICKSVSWSRTNGSVHIAAGYGNGIIACWDLRTKSKLLIVEDTETKSDTKGSNSKKDAKTKLTLLPTHSWLGHGSAVNSVKWCPYQHSKILASGGTMDRSIILWNFDDLSAPIRILKRGYVTSLDWIFRFSGLFASFDDCFLALKSNTNYIELADEDGRNTLSPHRSAVWSLSYSDWLNSEASSDSSGECLIFHDFHYRVSTINCWLIVRLLG